MPSPQWLSRSALLIGDEGIERLAGKHVLIVGLGGVGSFAAEAVARAGVGHLTIIDGDAVEASNRNRQLPALVSTQGQSKAQLMAARIRDINPDVRLTVVEQFLDMDGMRALLAEAGFDFVMDCIDSLLPKLTLLEAAAKSGLPLVSSMGAGGRMDPTAVKIGDLSESYNCRLAFYVRKRLRKRGIHGGFPVVFSSEPPLRESLMHTDGSNFKRSAYGTISYMPAVFGLTAASVCIRGLLTQP
jgi:tRNA A37 threonylcarbamoyladenosine dehydratase